MYKIKEFLGGKYDIFARGTFQQLAFLIIFSPFYTKMYKQDKLLFAIILLLITMSNAGIEFFSITKRGPEPQKYMGIFLLISLPINFIILLIFYGQK